MRKACIFAQTNSSQLTTLTASACRMTPLKVATKIMKQALRSIAGVLVVLISQPLMAENLLQVYEAAQENDALLRASRAGFAATEQAVPQARSALLPSLGANASTSWTEREFPGSVLQDQNFNDHGWNAQLRQSIVNMEAWFAYRSARSSVNAAEHNLAADEQNLIVRTVQAYLNVLRAQDLLDSTSAEEAAVKRQLEQVQQRFEVGLVAITDVLESQAVYDNAVVRRIQADGDHDIFFQSLSTLTGITYQELARLSEELPIVNPSPVDEDAWIEEAMRSNLNILAAQEQLAAARRNERARIAGHLPTVDATVTQVSSVTGAPNFFNADTTEQTVYALELNLPLYTGGFTSSRRKEASALKRQAQELLLNQQRTVIRDIRNLYQAVATDVVRVKARFKAIESSRSALEATETGYEVGTRNVVDVLQAQQLLFRSQFDYADSRYNYVLNLLFLKDVAGTLNDADLAELNKYTDASNPVKRLVSLRQRSGNTSPQ